MAGILFYFALLIGGETSLSGYLSPQQYWEMRGLAFEVDALSALVVVPQVDTEYIEKQILALGADLYEERNAASQTLADIGQPAAPYLEKALRSSDPEVAQRAKKLLQDMGTENAEEDELDAWMAVYSLSRMKDPRAKELLEKIANGQESEPQKQARALLKTKTKTTPAEPLPTNLQILSGFTENTVGVAQLRPQKFSSPVLSSVENSHSMQMSLISFLREVGDLGLHRVSVGVNEGVFTQENARITVWVEMDYSREKLSNWLIKHHHFKENKQDGPLVLKHRTMTLVMPNDQNLLGFLDFKNSHTVITVSEAMRMVEGRGALSFAEPLSQLLSMVPESSPFYAALMIPEAFDESKLDPFSAVDRALLQGAISEKGELSATLELFALKPEKNAEVEAAAQSQVAEVKALLLNDAGQEAQLFVNLVNTVKISEAESYTSVEARITSEFIEQIMQLQQRMADQRRGMMNRHRQKQMQNNNRMILH